MPESIISSTISKRIGIIGECMVELFDQRNGQCKRGFGGDTLNTAVYMARCAPDIAVHYVTALGDDALSEDMLQQWQAEGVLTDTVEQLPGQVPGLYMIQTDEAGERSFLYWRDQAPAKKLFQTAHAEALQERLLTFDWRYYSGITLAVLESAGREQLFRLLEQFRSNGGKVAFDINYRPRLWQHDNAEQWIRRAYQHCDLALPSFEDECALWKLQTPQDILQQLHALGCQEIVLKRGSDSCLVSESGNAQEYLTQAVSKVIDSTAAGDSFNAGYLARRIQGHNIADAVSCGQSIARQVITQQGAIVPIDTEALTIK
ncbi:MAG: sugar kinase [Thiolinea sp.]